MTNSSSALTGLFPALLRAVVTAGYVAVLIWVYIVWLSPRFGYLGFPYNPEPLPQLTTACVLAVAPSLFLPGKLSRPSDFINWMVYYLIYVPSAFVPALEGLITKSATFSVLLFISYMIILKFPEVKPVKIKLPYISKQVFWTTFLFIYAALSFYVFYVFRGSMNIASVENVYVQRELGGDVQDGTLAGYASGFLSGALNPFLLAVGVGRRKPWMIALGFAGQVLIYSTLAGKSIIMIGLLVPLFALYLHGKQRPVTMPIAVGLLVISFLPMVLYSFPLLHSVNYFVEDNIMQLLYMRTLEMPGGLTGIYGGFFENHPVTHYSHIGIVGKFIHYPYDLPLGVTVGYSIVGTSLDANANFFATDGLAALGNYGLLIASVMAGFLFRLIDHMLSPAVFAPFCAATVATVFCLANGSLFSTILTGGLGMLVIVFMFWGQVKDLSPAAAHLPSRIRRQQDASTVQG